MSYFLIGNHHLEERANFCNHNESSTLHAKYEINSSNVRSLAAPSITVFKLKCSCNPSIIFCRSFFISFEVKKNIYELWLPNS